MFQGERATGEGHGVVARRQRAETRITVVDVLVNAAARRAFDKAGESAPGRARQKA
jgi:hypothetical protein